MRGLKTPAREQMERDVMRFLKAHPRVTREDIRRACSGSDWALENHLRKLARDGVLVQCGRAGQKPLWTIHEPEEIAAITAQKRDGREAAIWRSMRIMKEFSPADLFAALVGTGAGIELHHVQAYCTMLARIQYLAVLRKAGPGRPPRYRLIRDTGPLPPVERRVQVVVDGNEDRIVFAGGERL